MEIIRLYYPEKDITSDKEKWEKWKEESNKKIKYEGDDFLFTGALHDGDYWEFVWVGNAMYKREYQKDMIIAPYPLFLKIFQKGNGPIGSVLCECGSNEFYITFGSYSAIAICTKCGKEGTVYSG